MQCPTHFPYRTRSSTPAKSVTCTHNTAFVIFSRHPSDANSYLTHVLSNPRGTSRYPGTKAHPLRADATAPTNVPQLAMYGVIPAKSGGLASDYAMLDAAPPKASSNSLNPLDNDPMDIMEVARSGIGVGAGSFPDYCAGFYSVAAPRGVTSAIHTHPPSRGVTARCHVAAEVVSG